MDFMLLSDIVFFLITAFVFLLILSVLVLIHEAGHFIVAKRLGIKVEEFGFGLPLLPAIFSFKHGETVYSIYPALIGGFVKLYGEDEAGAGRIKVAKDEEARLRKSSGEVKDEHRAYYSRTVGQRAAVVVAGVVMNSILAFAIYYVFMGLSNFKTDLPVYPPGLTVPKFYLVDQTVDSQIIINAVAKGSPAEKAGIKPISQILSVNGVKTDSMDNFLKIVKENRGKQISLEWLDVKTNKKTVSSIVPRVNPPKNQGSLGVSFFPAETIHLNYQSPVQKLLSGVTHPTNLMVYNFVALGHLVDQSIKQKNIDSLSQGVSGPVGIFSVVGIVIDIPNLKERVLQLLNLSGILSISLAFFNVLPIPGLDGGRLFLIILEGLFGLKLKPKTEGLINAAGMAFLITLILLITYKDILQFIVK